MSHRSTAYTAAHRSTPQRSSSVQAQHRTTVQWSTAQHSTMQHSTAQCITAQHSAAQCITVQRSAVALRCVLPPLLERVGAPQASFVISLADAYMHLFVPTLPLASLPPSLHFPIPCRDCMTMRDDITTALVASSLTVLNVFICQMDGACR